jgi:hypothetical protein
MTYKGFTLIRGRTFQDWRVDFPGRARWGTLAEIRQDVDAYLSEMLPHPRRGMN